MSLPDLSLPAGLAPWQLRLLQELPQGTREAVLKISVPTRKAADWLTRYKDAMSNVRLAAMLSAVWGLKGTSNSSTEFWVRVLLSVALVSLLGWWVKHYQLKRYYQEVYDLMESEPEALDAVEAISKLYGSDLRDVWDHLPFTGVRKPKRIWE